MCNFQDTSVTVFMYEDGTVCDPFDPEVHLCATFVPGGLIVDYRFVGWYNDIDAHGLDVMTDLGVDCVTVSEPINNIDDLRAALDLAMEV